MVLPDYYPQEGRFRRVYAGQLYEVTIHGSIIAGQWIGTINYTLVLTKTKQSSGKINIPECATEAELLTTALKLLIEDWHKNYRWDNPSMSAIAKDALIVRKHAEEQGINSNNYHVWPRYINGVPARS